MQLQRTPGDVAIDIGHGHLAHADVIAARAVRHPACLDLVYDPCSLDHHAAELFELDDRIGDLALHELVVTQHLALGAPRDRALEHHVDEALALAAFGSRRAAKGELARLAPTYGKLLFSKDCLAVPVREKCREGILAAHGPDGKLNPVIMAELTALFESDAMLQVQLDHYLALLEDVRGELARVFPNGPITVRKVRWAIDTRVQQNRLPPSEDIARLRTKLAAMPPEQYWPGSTRSSAGTRISRRPSTRTGLAATMPGTSRSGAA